MLKTITTIGLNMFDIAFKFVAAFTIVWLLFEYLSFVVPVDRSFLASVFFLTMVLIGLFFLVKADRQRRQ